MIKKLTVTLALTLLNNSIISKDQYDIYLYGLELLIPKFVFYSLVGIISILTDTFIPSFIFIIAYKGIRQYTGGYHSNSPERCLLVSILIYICLIILLYNFNLIIRVSLLAFSAVSVIIIFLLSPLEHKNKPIDTNDKARYRKNSHMIACAIFFISIFFYSYNILFISLTWSLVADAVLIIISYWRCKCEKRSSETDCSCN